MLPRLVNQIGPRKRAPERLRCHSIRLAVRFHSLPGFLMRSSWSTALFCFFMLLGSPGLAIRRGVCVSWPTRVRCRLLYRGSWSIVRGRSHFLVFPCCALQTYRDRQRWGSDAPSSCSQRHSFSTLFLRTICFRR